MRERLTIETNDRVSVRDITDQVGEAVPLDVGQGLCTVYVPHTTAGVTVNEAESRLLDDLEAMLADVVPADDDYGHDQIDDNADAHLRSALLGQSVTIPVSTGDLDLGTWQSVLFFEGDGPRRRHVDVTVVSA
ncbi:MAG: secondary thiamine-phosphate synthase enzyme YjbQ [Halanaeroarchaeum sp.]